MKDKVENYSFLISYAQNYPQDVYKKAKMLIINNKLLTSIIIISN